MTVDRNAGTVPARVMPGAGAYKWYLLGILVLINIMAAVDRSVISVIAEPLKTEFHLSDKQIGMLSGGGYSLSYGLAMLPMGWLIDRMDRRVLLSITLAIWSLLTAIGALSSNFITLIAARMGVGGAEAPSYPACLALIAETFPIKRRNTAVSIFVAGGPFGSIIIFVIGGWLLMHFNWRTVFLVAGGPGLLLAALLYFTTREPERRTLDSEGEIPVQDPRPKMKDTILRILGNAAICYAIAAITIETGVTYAMTVWTTSFLVRIHGLTVGHGAIWTGLGFGLGMTAGSLIVGPVGDRLSKGDLRKLTIIPAVTTMIAVFAGAVMALDNTLIVSLSGLIVVALMAGFCLSPGYLIVISLAAPNERGTTLAATKLVSILVGSSLIPLMTGTISDAVGGIGSIRPAILCTTTLFSLSTFCYVMIYKILDRQKKRTDDRTAR